VKPSRDLPDKEDLADLSACSLEGLTEEDQKAFQEAIESLVGPSDEAFDKKFQELVMTAGEAANAGKDEEAEQAAYTMLMMAGAKAMKSPSPQLQLANKASACESAGDWAEAEATYRELLALHERSGSPVQCAKPHCDLSRVLRFLGRLDEAWSHARAACECARPADLSPLTVMMLENETLCALERKDFSRALADAEEALQLLKPERMQNGIRMRTLTLRAWCRVESGDLKGAAMDLEAAEELQSDLPFSGMGGAVSLRARWWETRAELSSRQGDLTKALQNLTEAMALRREAADGCCSRGPYALVALARGLERFAEISKQLGDVAGGKEAIREAESLRRQAHLPSPAPNARPSAGKGISSET